MLPILLHSIQSGIGNIHQSIIEVYRTTYFIIQITVSQFCLQILSISVEITARTFQFDLIESNRPLLKLPLLNYFPETNRQSFVVTRGRLQ